MLFVQYLHVSQVNCSAFVFFFTFTTIWNPHLICVFRINEFDTFVLERAALLLSYNKRQPMTLVRGPRYHSNPSYVY